MWNMLTVKRTALVSFWHFWLSIASLWCISPLCMLYCLHLSKAISLCKAVVEHCFLLRSCILCFELCMTKVHIILIVSHKREPLNQLSPHFALFKFFIFMFYVGVLEKLYVGSLNKNTTKREIEEVSKQYSSHSHNIELFS